MKTITKLTLTLLIAGSMTSCISMQSVSITDIKPATGKEVKADRAGFGILSLTVPRQIAKRAADDLKSQGAVGNVSLVMTMRNWGIVQYYRVTATGTSEVSASKAK